MPLLYLEITDVQQKNLLEFLKRVQLTGAEAPALISIIQTILAAKPKKGLDQSDN